MLQLTFCPETFVVTISGEDLEIIHSIPSKIEFENRKISMFRREKPFLPVLHGKEVFSMSTKEGVAYLTIQCSGQECFSSILCALTTHYEVDRVPHQDSCTIHGFRKPCYFRPYRGPVQCEDNTELNARLDHFAELDIKETFRSWAY